MPRYFTPQQMVARLRADHTAAEVAARKAWGELAAMVAVESAGDASAVGDASRSHGCLQIGEAYFDDAVAQLRWEGKNPTYRWPQDVRDPRIARQIVRAYWRRWAPDALAEADFRTLARIHVGGPKGARKKCTEAYWQKVRREMTRLAEEGN
jgi:hypothetical protein